MQKHIAQGTSERNVRRVKDTDAEVAESTKNYHESCRSINLPSRVQQEFLIQ